jgi:hypothetical protein
MGSGAVAVPPLIHKVLPNRNVSQAGFRRDAWRRSRSGAVTARSRRCQRACASTEATRGSCRWRRWSCVCSNSTSMAPLPTVSHIGQRLPVGPSLPYHRLVTGWSQAASRCLSAANAIARALLTRTATSRKTLGTPDELNAVSPIRP